MQRIIGINKINRLTKKYSRPLIESCTGELLPSFTEGFDVTFWSNKKYLTGNSDIPSLLRMVNKYYPLARIDGIFNNETLMIVHLAHIDLRITLKDNKVIKTQINKAFACTGKDIDIEIYGNDLKKVFNHKVVKNNIEYAILKMALKSQYDI